VFGRFLVTLRCGAMPLRSTLVHRRSIPCHGPQAIGLG
jgi:hypothetical protein